MTSLFQEVLTDAKGVEARLMGPTYPYYDNIKTPAQLGMGTKGTIQQMSADISGLINYVEVLVSGKSRASATGQPLGNKFFLQTGAKCSATDTCSGTGSGTADCQLTDRYIYVDNVPAGNIPFVSSGMGTDFTDFRGLIPGAMGNLEVLNPFAITRAFLAGSNPPCQQITLQTISNDNVQSSETHYVTLTDIADMDPCTFPDGTNPATGAKCAESFQARHIRDRDRHRDRNSHRQSNVVNNYVLAAAPLSHQLYFASISVLALVVLYHIMQKSH